MYHLSCIKGPRTSTWARAGATARERVSDAGDGLFATRRFLPGQEILDYRYVGGKQKKGDEVDKLTLAQFRSRYPPEEGMPEGRGTHGHKGDRKAPFTTPELHHM